MEFIKYLSGGLLDLIILIMIIPLLPFVMTIECKLNTFIKEEILIKIFSEEGLF